MAEQIEPATSIAEALSATIAKVVDEHGLAGACERIPGLYVWGEVCGPCFTGIGDCLGCVSGKRRQAKAAARAKAEQARDALAPYASATVTDDDRLALDPDDVLALVSLLGPVAPAQGGPKDQP